LADIKKDDLRKTERIVITTRKGKEITKIVFPNRLQVGITDADFHPGAQIFGSVGVSGSLTVSGSSTFTVHGPSIFNGNIKSSGFVTSSMGFSGSLTRLADGRSYLAAGINVTITSESNGQVTVSAAGGSGSPGGSDTQLQYNDGGSFGGISAFTWDDTDLLVGTTTKLMFRDSDLYIDSPANGKLHISSDSQVLIMSGGAPGSSNEANGTDVNFFISGSIGSKSTVVRGTALLGGDLVVSGTIIAAGSLSGSLTRLVDGDSFIEAGENITVVSASNGSITISAASGGGGIEWDGSTVDGIATFKDSDEATVQENLRFNGSALHLTGALNVKYAAKTANFSVATTDYIIGVNTSGGAVTATLPSAATAGAGRMLIVKDIGGFASESAKAIIITPAGSEKIDGANSVQILASSGSVSIFTDGSNWYVNGVS